MSAPVFDLALDLLECFLFQREIWKCAEECRRVTVNPVELSRRALSSSQLAPTVVSLFHDHSSTATIFLLAIIVFLTTGQKTGQEYAGSSDRLGSQREIPSQGQSPQ